MPAMPLSAKTGLRHRRLAPGMVHRPVRLPGCNADAKLPDMNPREATDKGVKTMVIGVVNAGGVRPMNLGVDHRRRARFRPRRGVVACICVWVISPRCGRRRSATGASLPAMCA